MTHAKCTQNEEGLHWHCHVDLCKQYVIQPGNVIMLNLSNMLLWTSRLDMYFLYSLFKMLFSEPPFLGDMPDLLVL